MPVSERQRRAAFAEIRRRKSGRGTRTFEGLATKRLERFASSPLEKEVRRGRKKKKK